MATTLAHWSEWRARCALARCDAATATALRGFAWSRFQNCARRALGDVATAALLPSAAECWHLLETHLAVARPRSGRRYKEWLFARLEGSRDAPLDVIQGGASLLVRSVARHYLTCEGPQLGVRSLDAPVGAEGDGPTLAELIPAPPPAAEDPEGRDFRELVAPLCAALFAALDRRERLVVLAKHLGVALTHPAVLAATGTAKSLAYELWRDVFARLARQVRTRFADEPPETQLQLALTAHEALAGLLLSWGRVEKGAQGLFQISEERP